MLLRLEEKYKEKHEKYSNALDRLMWLNACLRRPKCSLWNIECGNIEYVHWSSCEHLPVSISLGAVSLAGTSVSGMTMALTKKY